MTDDLDIDAIEAAPWYYAEGHEGRVVELCQEVRRLRAALAESQAGEAEWQEHASNNQGHYMREGERCDRAEAERDARPAITREDCAAKFAGYVIGCSDEIAVASTLAERRIANALREHAKGAKP